MRRASFKPSRGSPRRLAVALRDAGEAGSRVPAAAAAVFGRRAFPHSSPRACLQAAVGTLTRNGDSGRAHGAICSRAAERDRAVLEALDAEERTRAQIARHLHDIVLPALCVVRQDLAEAAMNPVRRDVLIERARGCLVHAIDDVRSSVLESHPVVLKHEGLRGAIEAVAAHHAKYGGFEVEIDVEPDAEGVCDPVILSLCRELLSNVSRHARARHVDVVLRREDDHVRFEVSDDGCGLGRADVTQAPARGHVGLASLRELVEAVGGRFELSAGAGVGTTVRAVLPSHSAATEEDGAPREGSGSGGPRPGFDPHIGRDAPVRRKPRSDA
jgi:signal transduction histidine kinase